MEAAGGFGDGEKVVNLAPEKASAGLVARADAHWGWPSCCLRLASAVPCASLSVWIYVPPLRPQKLATHYLLGWGAVGDRGLRSAKIFQKFSKNPGRGAQEIKLGGGPKNPYLKKWCALRRWRGP